MDDKITIREFSKICNDLGHYCVIFDTWNQSWLKNKSTIQVTMFFDKVVTIPGEQVIGFTGEHGHLTLQFIKKIKEAKQSILGRIFDITCREEVNGKSSDITYTLIVQTVKV